MPWGYAADARPRRALQEDAKVPQGARDEHLLVDASRPADVQDRGVVGGEHERARADRKGQRTQAEVVASGEEHPVAAVPHDKGKGADEALRQAGAAEQVATQQDLRLAEGGKLAARKPELTFLLLPSLPLRSSPNPDRLLFRHPQRPGCSD